MWYSVRMSQNEKHTNDAYFSELADAAESGRQSAEWLQEDFSGQLAVDVLETPDDIIVRAAIAGVQASDIDITVNNDLLTIKGLRKIEEEPSGSYLYQECYWGGFSRSIILPVEVRSDEVQATMRNGILRVILPKVEQKPSAPIRVVEEEV
jgi:HSP20 family protein